MTDNPPHFVNTQGLARACFMDHRTLRSRLDALNISADAQFLESGGLSDLFLFTRIPAIRERVGGIVRIHGINVGITSPIFQS